MRQETQDFISRLTDQEKADLTAGLMSRIRKDAHSQAIVVSSLLESNLKVAGYRDLAEQAEAIHNTLIERDRL